MAQAYIPNHSLCSFMSLMERVVVGKGLHWSIREGIMLEGWEANATFQPFILSNNGVNIEACIEEAQLGWEALRDFI